MEPTFIQTSSEDSFQEETTNSMVSSPCPSTYTSMV